MLTGLFQAADCREASLNILITGGARLIGSNSTDALGKRGDDVPVLADLPTDRLEATPSKLDVRVVG